MIKRLVLVLCILFIAATAAACAHPNSDLIDNIWLLESYGTPADSKAVLADSTIAVVFNAGKREVSGSTGCNTYLASYKIDGNNLSISNLAWTERACLSPAGVMDQEREFLSLLSDARSFQIDDARLTITCSDGGQLYYTRSGTK
jgi:heat shock protein HslJ